MSLELLDNQEVTLQIFPLSNEPTPIFYDVLSGQISCMLFYHRLAFVK